MPELTTVNIHLLVLLHGMWGNPSHLAEMKRIYSERWGKEGSEHGRAREQLHIFVPETIRESQTYDGIDWGGERVAQEVRNASPISRFVS